MVSKSLDPLAPAPRRPPRWPGAVPSPWASPSVAGWACSSPRQAHLSSGPGRRHFFGGAATPRPTGWRRTHSLTFTVGGSAKRIAPHDPGLITPLTQASQGGKQPKREQGFHMSCPMFSYGGYLASSLLVAQEGASLYLGSPCPGAFEVRRNGGS